MNKKSIITALLALVSFWAEAQVKVESSSSRWDRYLGMTAVMTQVPVPTAIWKRTLQELYRLISQLGELERALILLWLDDKSYEEIAEILSISVSNVGVRINRVKSKLREMSNH